MFARVEELFNRALELPPDERSDYLETACDGDATLRQEVEELLEALEKEGDYFEDLSGSIARSAGLEIDESVRGKVQVGPYRALRVIGHGGMGVVYLAERMDGQFDHQVALKLIHLDMLRPSMQARFLRERQLLARLSHPNIARLLDGGLTSEGRPYFVMEYVQGRSLVDHCREGSLGLKDRLRLFLELIDAVSYLHRNLVVHRDLKPSNVLVDQEGHVRLLDFGIAKILDETDDLQGLRTVTGERLMSPSYAAPEQASGETVTTSTDVYALGIVLAELLTGSRDSSGQTSTTSDERHSAPSARLKSLVEGPTEGIEGPISWRQLVGDLDTICLKASRREPERRYVSAAQLGEDIQRFLDGLPVLARPSTLRYRCGKWMHRHRLEATAGLAILLLILVSFLRERSLRADAETARSTAQQETIHASAVSGFLEEILSSSDPRKAQGRELSVAEVLDDAATRLEVENALVEHPAAEAEVRLVLGRTYTSLTRWEEAANQLVRALELRGGAQDSSLEALTVLQAQGVLAYRSGQYDEAEAPLLRVLDGRRRQLGEAHAETLETMGHLANLYWYQSRLDEAESLDRQTVTLREQTSGAGHPDTLRALNGLAATLFARARFGEAAETFARALEGQRLALGDSHPDTIGLKNNLAAAYSELGRYLEAEELQREVVEERTRVLGSEHVMTTLSRNNLGISLMYLGEYSEAEQILRETLALRSAGEAPGGRLHTQSFLAQLYFETGRVEEAEALYESTLAEQRQIERLESDALRSAAGLAEVYLERGNLDRAEGLLREQLSLQLEAHNEDHPDTVGIRTALSEVLLAAGDLGGAREEIDTALQSELEVNSPVFEAAELQRLRLDLAMGKSDGVLPRLREILASRTLRVGPQSPLSLEVQELLVDAPTEPPRAVRTSPR